MSVCCWVELTGILFYILIVMALIAKNSTIFAKVSVAIWLKILKVNIIQRLVEQCNFDADLSISLYYMYTEGECFQYLVYHLQTNVLHLMVKVSRQGHFWSRACIGSSFDLAVKKRKFIGAEKVARIFRGGGGGWSHSVTPPGYLPDWHVDIRAVTERELFLI